MRKVLWPAAALLLLARAATADGIDWIDNDYDKAVAKAKETGKLVQMNWHAEWCHFCHKLADETFVNEEVIAFSNGNFVNLRMDKDKFEQIADKFNVGGIPDTLFVTGDGRVISRILGFMPADAWLAEVKQIPDRHKRLLEVEALVAKDDKNGATRLELGMLLKGTGDRAGAEKQFRAVLELDKDNARGQATEAWWAIADMELNAEEPDVAKAKDAMEKIRGLDAKNEKGRTDDAACGLAMLLMDQDPVAAREAFGKVIADFPKTNGTAQAMFMIAALKANVDGDLDAAEAGMKALAEEFPEDDWGKRAKDAVEQIAKMRGAGKAEKE
ncbi:MAG: DUF255 domain-containing protein [Candidatus Brocadiae bacterium]|nr:DUF255 domain-containing protein [Candidatus Brocadiia bacterium]